MLWSQRGLCPDQFSLVPGDTSGRSEIRVVLVLHGRTPQLPRMTIMRPALKNLSIPSVLIAAGFRDNVQERWSPCCIAAVRPWQNAADAIAIRLTRRRIAAARQIGSDRSMTGQGADIVRST